MAGSGLGGSPFSKERLDAGNGIQLGVVCDGREVCERTGEYRESVGDVVGRNAGQLCQIGVTELDGVRKQQGLGDFLHDVEAAVVLEGGENVETITHPKVPGFAPIGIVMDENLAAERAEWSGIVAVGTVEIFPIGD